MEFRVDIEDSSGNKLGSGPLQSVSRWRYTARFDRAGEVDFTFAATDPQADQVTPRRIARAHALINGTWTEVGAGVIDSIETAPGNDGRVSLSAGGMDLIRELSYRSVGNLEVGSGSGTTHSAALTAISALAPAGWTFTPASSPDNDYIYARYGGESVLGALVYLAERTQTHFYRSTNRTLVFTSSFSSSGVRAIQATDDLTEYTCAIVSLRRTVDTHDLLTRITPYGSGQGEARLTLAATSRTSGNLPSGYTFSAANNYIENSTATSTYGLVNFPEIEFKEITPISNTDSDLEAAANMLFDAALEELERRSTLASQETYTLTVAGCSQLLRPMQTIRLVYRDVDQGIDINDDLYILEATWEIDSDGIRTSQLVVSTDDRWPESDASAAAERAVQGRVFTAHPQLNANSYVTAYTKNVDHEEIAAFRFRFGAEVVNLQQALFEFQLLPFESTVKSVGGVTSGSGAIATGGPSTNSTGNGGNNETGNGGPTSTAESTPTIGSSTPTIGSSTPTIGSSTPSIGSATPTIGSSTPTVGNTGLTTNTPTGGSTDGSGDHQHHITVIAGSGSLGEVSLHETGGQFFLANPFITGSEEVFVNYVGFHTHTVNAHTHTIDPHNHTISSHTHTIAAHTHTIDSHTHTIAAHTHTIAAHTHTITAHTHSLSQHTHSLNNHTHDLSESISAVYGIFRAEETDTYGIDELKYRVNGGSWTALNTADDVSDGWYALDITSQVQDTTTFRPEQENNLLEIKIGGVAISSWSSAASVDIALPSGHGFETGDEVVITDAVTGSSGSNINGTYTITNHSETLIRITVPGAVNPDSGGAGGTVGFIKTATIDAQLSIRNTIQAIAYT